MVKSWARRATFGEMREGVGKAGASGDLQQDLRQVDLRQPGSDRSPQGQQRRRRVKPVERTQHQLLLVVHGLEAHGGIGRQARGNRPIGLIQFGRQRRQGRRRLGGQSEAAANHGARGFPLRAGQQAGTWIGVAPAGSDEDLAATQRTAQFVEYAKRIGAHVDAAVLAQHIALPRLRDHVLRRRRDWIDTHLVQPQPREARCDRFAGGAGVEANVLQQRRQEEPHRTPACIQFTIVDIVRWTDQGLNVVQCLCQCLAWDACKHRGEWIACEFRIEQRAAGCGQGGRGLIEILEGAQARLLIGLAGGAEELVQQHVQHFDHVVLGGRLQAVHEGDQRGQATRRWQSRDGGDLGGAGEARERGEPAGRHRSSG